MKRSRAPLALTPFRRAAKAHSCPHHCLRGPTELVVTAVPTWFPCCPNLLSSLPCKCIFWKSSSTRLLGRDFHSESFSWGPNWRQLYWNLWPTACNLLASLGLGGIFSIFINWLLSRISFVAGVWTPTKPGGFCILHSKFKIRRHFLEKVLLKRLALPP